MIIVCFTSYTNSHTLAIEKKYIKIPNPSNETQASSLSTAAADDDDSFKLANTHKNNNNKINSPAD
jgi:hypothetical protein